MLFFTGFPFFISMILGSFNLQVSLRSLSIKKASGLADSIIAWIRSAFALGSVRITVNPYLYAAIIISAKLLLSFVESTILSFAFKLSRLKIRLSLFTQDNRLP